jgi:hypothetical protein
MTCPICGAAAEDITSGVFDGLQVRCPRCGDFEVSGTVLERLLRQGYEERVEALEKARRLAPKGQRPIINSVTLS